MFSGVHNLMKGKSDFRAKCTARAVLPHPTGPAKERVSNITAERGHFTYESFRITLRYSFSLFVLVVFFPPYFGYSPSNRTVIGEVMS